MSQEVPARVPFFRPSVGEEEIQAVAHAIRSGWLTSGPRCAEFETAFSSYLGGAVDSIAVNSATAALHLGLEALGVSEGDEIIVPTLTFTATAEVVRYLGATPVFVDIDPNTLCVDPAAVQAAITDKTRVVMPVHFAGRMAPMAELCRLAGQYGLRVLADAAHALPATDHGNMVGCCGADATAFSFYANKTMTTGEGGMLVSADSAVIKRAKHMRLHGIDRDVFNRFTDPRASWFYDVIAPGYKYNLTDVAAAMGLVQLGRLAEFQRLREARVARYNEALGALPVALPPSALPGDVHSWHLYIIQLLPDAPVTRDAFCAAMQEAGIGISVHYRPLHQMTAWRPFAGERQFPVANQYYERCVSLPLFMSMTDIEQERVIDVVRTLLSA